MPNTYTQLYVQIVFAVKGRQNLISSEHKNDLHSYITAIVQNRGAKLLAIHCMPDHAHLFIGFRPTLTISDLVRDVKADMVLKIRTRNFFNFVYHEP
ncbi:IS200/IS605 family transposase, partial [Spirosoma litoris]